MVTFNKDRNAEIRYPKLTELMLQLNQRWIYEVAEYHTHRHFSRLNASFWATIQPIQKMVDIFHAMNGFKSVAKESDKLPAAKFVISEMHKLTQDIGAELVVVYIPLYFEESVDKMPDELKDFLDEYNIKTVDLEPELNRMKQEGVEIGIPGDGHMSTYVHAQIAEKVASVINFQA